MLKSKIFSLSFFLLLNFLNCSQNLDVDFDEARRFNYEKMINCLINEPDFLSNDKSKFINCEKYIEKQLFPSCVDTKKILTYNIEYINIISEECIVFIQKPKVSLKKKSIRFVYAKTLIAKEKYFQTRPMTIKFRRTINDKWSEFQEVQTLAD